MSETGRNAVGFFGATRDSMSNHDNSQPVEPVDARCLQEVVAVHCEAFHDYPTMRFVLGEGGDDYEARLATLVSFFVESVHLKGGLVFGSREEDELVAAADTVLYGRPEPPELARRREAAWESLGEPARARYESYSAATRAFAPDAPSYYLSMLGVRRRAAGRGLARALVERVQAQSRADPASTGVFLETEDPSNVAFYQYLGFEMTGHFRLGDDLESWGFFRPDGGA